MIQRVYVSEVSEPCIKDYLHTGTWWLLLNYAVKAKARGIYFFKFSEIQVLWKMSVGIFFTIGVDVSLDLVTLL